MLIFNAEDHTYHLDGRKLPSVTEIMKAVGYDPYFGHNQEAMELGSNVHLTTRLYDEGDLNEADLHPVLAGYLEGWKRWKEERLPTLTRTTVVDIKTNSTPWTVGVQMAMYEILVRANSSVWDHEVCIEQPLACSLGFAGTADRVYMLNPDVSLIDRLAVELHADGKYAMAVCNRRKDREMAMAALSLYHDIQNHCQ